MAERIFHRIAVVTQRVPRLARRLFRVVLILAGVFGSWSSAPVVAQSIDNAAQRELFEKHVRPLFNEYCYECHSAGAKKIQGGLRLDSRAGILQGGESGPAVVPGDSGASLLLQALRYESFEMPPRRRLPEGQVAYVERWIQAGAWWPNEPDPVAGPADNSDSETAKNDFDWHERKEAHWAWHPPVRPAPPVVGEAAWCRNTIDQFILAKLEASRLMPAADATREQLLRRLFFDLTGLPPTAADVEAFVTDNHPDAYEQVVDRLLASPRFGETWARHWMDLVRYADTCGHEFDYPLQHSERYRDYLIRAWNDDIGYDQLVKEHIAGDLIDPRRDPVTGWNESILGTGFWFLGEAVHAPTDVRGDESDRIDNQLDVFGKTFLGVTLACARCHDHKFDPIPTHDYYAMAGILQSSRRQRAMLDPHDNIGHHAARLAKLHAVPEPPLASSASNLAAQLRAAVAARCIPPSEAAPTGQSTATGSAESAAAESIVDDTSSTSTEFAQRLDRALQDPDIKSASHPAYVLRELWKCNNPATAGTRIQTLRNEIMTQQTANASSQQNTVNLVDFRHQDFSEWFTTGFAFGTSPTRSLRIDSLSDEPRFGTIGAADSSQSGRRLRGVLRSPTFEIKHHKIHYRIKCDQVQIRLIVDGYVMDTFSSLLFADCTLSNVKTDGEFRWVTQQRDLDHYQGHRAHIEILDEADGYATVEQIVFSDGPPPVDPPSPLALCWAQTAPIDDNMATHIDWWAQQLHFGSANDRKPASNGQAELLNWLLKWQIVKPSDTWRAQLRQIREEEAATPEPVYALAMTDGTPEDERIHIRGKHRNLGNAVPRHMLVAIAGENQIAPADESGRRMVAQQLVDPQNPLVARVIVNRLWHHVFGQGIVASVDDFGVMGVAPTHPELLDWLALDLIDQHWSLKRCLRQMVLSRTYQMASVTRDQAAEIQDPENLLLHRASVRRITAEAMRDAILQQSGRLNDTMYGVAVPIYLTPFMTGRGRPESGPLDGDGRRSVYVKIQRNFLSPTMLAFDMPSPFSTMGRRSRSNVPAQSLILMNDEFIWAEASRWAKSLLREHPDSDARIDQLFLTSCGHNPNAFQRQQIREFIAAQAHHYGEDESSLAVWTDVCHAVWNLKEFIYLF